LPLLLVIILVKKNKFMKNKEFLTAKELAETLRVNIMTIYRYIKANKLKAYKIGKEFRIDEKEFNNFLNKAKKF
jgi:excisionase family DNA binding protein